MLSLKATFQQLLSQFVPGPRAAGHFWDEVYAAYTQDHRHYHTLQHLQMLLQVLSAVRSEIRHWDAVLFALVFHDIVYDPESDDNERQSAVFAIERMKRIEVPRGTIGLTAMHILATRHHSSSSDSDTDYFTDADIAILGQEWAVYQQYCSDVRKEYLIYPDDVYRSGRKKVLMHFLKMDRIYKTGYFYDLFEAQARRNLESELAGLRG